MKIRNLVVGMMTCAAFTACTSEEIIDNKVGGKLEGEAYVAVNIITPAGASTRADVFEDGTGAESTVNSATFLFFDAAGNPCANKTVTDAELKDWVTGSNGSIEKKATVMLLNPVEGAIPSSVIAILNAPAGVDYTAKTLTAIKEDIKNEEAYKAGFIMTNSVYGKNNEAVVEVPLSIENLATTEALAMANPIKIPVERVVARVDLNKNSISESGEQEITVDNKKVKVKAVIKGWKVTATNPSSYLLKTIDVAGFNRDFGGGAFNWNDEANTRSYWATSATPTAYNFYTYSDAVTNNANASEYCLENTSAPWANLPTYSTATKLWVVAQLINVADGASISIMEWRGSKATPDGVKASMANLLKKYYFVASGTIGVDAVYKTLAPSDLTFTKGSTHYYAKAALASTTKKFYTLVTNADNSITATDATAALTTDVDALPEAQAWTDGMTYYYTNIRTAGSENGGIYGIVRNHIYKLKLTSIGGLGTPIYDPNEKIDPTKPSKEDKSYVAAEVNVLKWKVVEQNIDLQ